MKILAPTAGPVPAKHRADYTVNIAKRLGADLVALHVLTEETRLEDAKENLNIFSKAGQTAKVNVNTILKKTDLVPAIIECAEEESVDLIIMGASRSKVVAEWVSADVTGKAKIPVVVLPHEFKKL